MSPNKKHSARGRFRLVFLIAALLALRPGGAGANAQSPSPSPVPVANPTARSAVVLTPSKLSFGSQAVNQTSAALGTAVKNSGATPWSISIAIDGGNAPGDYVAGGNCPISPNTLGSGESCRITVTFTPSALGQRTATLTVKTTDHEVPQSLPLEGKGIEPADLTPAPAEIAETASSIPGTIAGNPRTAGPVPVEAAPSQKLSRGRVTIPSGRAGNGLLPVTLAPLSSSGTALGLVSIVVTPANPSLVAGNTQQFTATGVYSDGTTVNLTGSVGWGSSATSIASMNGAGLAAGLAPGSAVITASFAAAASPPAAKADSVTVSAPPIVVSPPSVLEGSTTLTVTSPAGATFTSTGNLNTARAGQTATLLDNGQVLVAGGAIDANLDPTAAAELYDPTLGTFTTTGNMNTPRYFFTATLLNNGLVLVAGGLGPGGNSAEPTNSAELYNPATGTFNFTGNLNTARALHTATLLPDGQVLIVGGSGGDGTPVSTAEIYDPLSGSFTPLDFYLNYARYAHTATLLPTGMVLIAGGYNDGALNTAELYDPAARAFTYTTNPSTGSQTILNAARYYHTATLLNDGQVLLVGGVGQSTTTDLASAELYNPATETFTYTGSLATLIPTGLDSQTATLLNNGLVLVAGGEDFNQNPLASASLYNPATGTFTATGNLKVAVDIQTATLLNNGTVLITGGFSDASGGVTAGAEFYTPVTLTPPNLASISLAPAAPTIPLGGGIRFTATGTFSGGDAEQLNEVTWTSSNPGVVSVSNDASNSGEAWAAGTGSTTITACAGAVCGSTTAAVGSPGPSSITGTGAFNVTGAMVYGRVEHTATLLPNGQVLLAGGVSYSYGFLSSAELFDPNAGTFTSTGNLITAREAHTAKLLNNGLILMAGGYGPTGYLDSAELYNPATGTFSPTGNLNVARYSHTATLLPDGQVLIAGGSGLDGILTSAELYDPVTGTFTLTGNLSDARLYHTATLLNNGQVLIAGGVSDDGLVEPVELYNPATGTFAFTGPLNYPRQEHTATLLNNGMVLIAGGVGSGGFFASGELYDPVAGAFTVTGSLNDARRWHTATLLTNGLVLVAGGAGDSELVSSSAELYDPTSGVFGITGSLNDTHQQATATLLNNGTVLIAGGYDINEFTSGIAEIYDPATLTPPNLVSISIAPGNPTVPLGASVQLTATGTFSSGSTEQLAEAVWTSSNPGVVSVSDDASNAGTAMAVSAGSATISACAGLVCGSATVTVGPPVPNRITGTATFVLTDSLNTARWGHTATLLNNGLVLIAGGQYDLSGDVTNSAELYNPATGTFSLTGTLNTGRVYHTATLLNNGLVLIAGGEVNYTPILTAELYNPATGTFTFTGSLNTARYGHTATLLDNGLVLIAGGNYYGAFAGAELYNPATGTFTPTGSLITARYDHTATLLNDSLVLIEGGWGANGILASAELYNPATGTFTATGNLNTVRVGHTATLLNNGLVLIEGGVTANEGTEAQLYSDIAELYNPATGTFALTGSLSAEGEEPTATLLNNGEVLIAGGYNLSNGFLNSAQLYNPAAGTFTPTGNLNYGRQQPTATLLNNGMVLIAGGADGLGALASAELYDPATLTPPGLVSIALTPDNPTIPLDTPLRFIAYGTFTGGITEQLASVTWTSSDLGVISISNDASNSGAAYAAAPGAATLSACAGAVCGVATASVGAPVIAITISPGSATVAVGGFTQFFATGTLSTGGLVDLTTSVSWSSSSPGVATVSAGGLAGGLASGDTAITATLGEVQGTATLHVTP